MHIKTAFFLIKTTSDNAQGDANGTVSPHKKITFNQSKTELKIMLMI